MISRQEGLTRENDAGGFLLSLAADEVAMKWTKTSAYTEDGRQVAAWTHEATGAKIIRSGTGTSNPWVFDCFSFPSASRAMSYVELHVESRRNKIINDFLKQK